MMNELRKIPEHEAIYRQIRDAILFGSLVPGQAVTIQGLTEMIGAGMTPVREAIRRLTSEGALLALGNRRIVVPSLDLIQIEQLRFARLAIEPELARRAAKRVHPELINELTEIDAALDTAISSGSVEGYLQQNYRFHFRIYEAADADLLREMALSLWLRSGPSSRIVCGKFGTANLPDMHDQMMDALRAGDGGAMADAMAMDITQGMDLIGSALH